MLPRQMSPRQLESVFDVPSNLPLKFGQNQVSNRKDIADIEFVWMGGSDKLLLATTKPNMNSFNHKSHKTTTSTSTKQNNLKIIGVLIAIA